MRVTRPEPLGKSRMDCGGWRELARSALMIAHRVGPDTVIMPDVLVRTVDKFLVVRVQILIDAALTGCREQILI